MNRKVLGIFSTILLLFILLLSYLLLRDTYKPLHLVSGSERPSFTDDLDIASLILAAQKQRHYLQQQDPEKTVAFGEITIPFSWLLLSMESLLEQLHKRPDKGQLASFVTENYQIFQAGGRKKRKAGEMLVTGYYEPVFAGNVSRQPPYLYPLYKRPPSLIQKDGKLGRYDSEQNFVSYWSRREIENNRLLEGRELAWLSDPFDAYLLHVQGSGKLRLPDNSVRSVSFAGSNGLEYKSIGKLLVDKKIMALADVNIPSIRAYLEQHPRQLLPTLQHNPRFIFFDWGDNLGPRGSSGEVLTPGRSIAIDSSSLPEGTLAYLSSKKPLLDGDGKISHWVEMNRFVFPQDSGAAIKGTGRVDLFWGNGRYAETAANNMKEPGKLYFLVKKGYPGVERQ